MKRIDEVINRIEDSIQKEVYKPGQRLLSVRMAAIEYGLSKNSIVEVYDRLVAKGLIFSRPGAGYYVSQKSQIIHRKPSSHVTDAIDSISLLREQLEHRTSIRVGDGRPPVQWMERLDIGKEISLLRHRFPAESWYDYNSPWGFLPLREHLALMLEERSIHVSVDNILLTQGANHALDLVSRHLLEPGDVVFVDSPGYYPLIAKLKLLRVTIIGIRRTESGPDIEDLNEKCNLYKPKVFFTQSLAHNPTGTSTTLPTAHKILQAAESFDFYIVEDDPFADILPASAPRLATLDQLSRVIYIGTFSKILSAGVRVGYIAAERKLINTLCDIKMITIVNTPDILERLVYHIIEKGKYVKHIRSLRSIINKTALEARESLKNMGLILPYESSVGYYLWAEFPYMIDEIELMKEATKQDIFLAPGSLFNTEPEPDKPAAFRVNIAYASNEKLTLFMKEIIENNYLKR